MGSHSPTEDPMITKLIVVGVSSIALVAGPGLAAGTADAAVSAKKFSNCAKLNKVYPHGVGRPGAVDKTSGERVTNFTRNRKVYKQNKKGRDRDKDGIACEKH
jgi:hypothetical protein